MTRILPLLLAVLLLAGCAGGNQPDTETNESGTGEPEGLRIVSTVFPDPFIKLC